MLDMAVLASEIASIVTEEVERATAPLILDLEGLKKRLAAAEAREPVDVQAAVDKAFTALDLPVSPEPMAPDMVEIDKMVAAHVSEKVAAIPVPRDGTSVTLEDVRPLIADEVAKSVAAIPPVQPVAPDMLAIERIITEKVAAIPIPGPAAPLEPDMAHIERTLSSLVKAAFDALPAPEPGKPGENGDGLAGALIDRDGCLVITLSSGEMINLGKVVGKDGEPGKNAEPIGLEDINMELMEDDRTLRISVSKGDYEYAFQVPFPVVLDRGVWQDKRAYDEGDGVTWGGSFWIAQRAIEAGVKPDAPGSGFRLAVKRGRDGKDHKPQQS